MTRSLSSYHAAEWFLAALSGIHMKMYTAADSIG